MGILAKRHVEVAHAEREVLRKSVDTCCTYRRETVDVCI
jgi:hypothetical protein